MIALRRPSDAEVQGYLRTRSVLEPTSGPFDLAPDGSTPSGFHRFGIERVVGSGAGDLASARDGLREWAAHRGSGVAVTPDHPPEPGLDVTVLTRQVGVWVLAACRVTEVVDEPARYGFTYATLPDHPESGEESFTVTMDGSDGAVAFRVDAVSRPGTVLVRLGGPIPRLLQRRAADAYVTALQRRVRNHG